jgi:dGTPase
MKFEDYKMCETHPDYLKAIKRQKELYTRRNDLRSEFGRDYTRIIFSQGYRRLKHKTQVFFAVKDDHVCTRSEHVNLVESISYTIASQLGLNTELTKAISVGHDIGHAPFGHGGETILSKLCTDHGLEKFWHEKNSLRFVDNIELLEDNEHYSYNLNLTYAVRDGIISHCGEMNQKFIQRRNEYIDLNDYEYPGQYNPYTYEACVVKMSDKIAYLARDIEDALRLNILDEKKVNELKEELNKVGKYQFQAINNGSIVNYFIYDVIENSCIEKGIGLSDEAFLIMKKIMSFNYENIYLIKRVKVHINYVSLILNSIFDFLYEYHNKEDIIKELEKDKKDYPELISHYISWIIKYSNINKDFRYKNKILYDLSNKNDIIQCIIDYLSGMSDDFIIKAFNELLTF